MSRSPFGLFYRTILLTTLFFSSLHLVAGEDKKELKDLKLALSKAMIDVDSSLALKEGDKSISSDDDLSQCGGGCSLYRTGPLSGRNRNCVPSIYQQYGPHGQVLTQPNCGLPARESQLIGPGPHEPTRAVTPNLQVPQQTGKLVTVYADNQQGYTINFDNIPVVELIRFISRITNTNFIFDSNDIPFSITIVSEDQMTVAEVMSSLLQVLRMNGLSVTEQGNNIIIYNNQSVSRVSTIVTDDNLNTTQGSAVITRVFRLYNVVPERIAQIVAPLLSKDALVEVSRETRHLIVTDITANVDKIADLLQALDVPDGTVDVGQYFVKTSFPDILISIANRILAPLATGNVFNLVPQVSTNSIFIVSTPYLINKALALFASLDVAPTISPEAIAAQFPAVANIDLPSDAMVNTNFYVYKLQYHSGQEIADALRDIGASLQFSGLANMDLVSAINSLQWIVTNNSLVFSGTDAAIDKIRDLLGDLDVAPKQVYIEVLILDTTIANSLDFGVEWVALGREHEVAYGTGFITPANDGSFPGQGAALLQGARAAFDSSYTKTNPQGGYPARGGANGTSTSGPCSPSGGVCGDVPFSSGFNLGVVGNLIRHNGNPYLTLAALLKALESESETVIILNPRIMTEDTKEANVFVGQNIPYQTTSVVQKDTGTVTTNIQYEDVGVQLRVTPIIGANGIVTLEIDQSISDVVNSTVASSGGGGVSGSTTLLVPTTTKTLTSTRVHVPDGAFLVMSGMMRDQSTFSRTGIPCLGTLPYIGPTFSTTHEQRTKRNLIIFVKPRIVTTSMMGIELTNEEGCLYNFESHPCSIKECGTWRAPECEELRPGCR